MRTKLSFEVANIFVFKEQLLNWSQQYHETVWLDSNSHTESYSSFDAILAVDALTVLQTDTENAFENLKEYQSETKDWIFGYLTYDLKNDVEVLSSTNYDGLNFPELFFFQPKKIIRVKGNQVEFIYLNMVNDEIEGDFITIENHTSNYIESDLVTHDIRIKMRIFKDEYFRGAEEMLKRIHRGDIYEANFCQEFYAERTVIDPLRTYENLNAISNAPFSTFLKLDDKYLMCTSPERYLRKQGNKIISQPIKGTAKRSSNVIEDEELKDALKTNPKERSENIMIVDLVRNDLSKSALKGSVKVEELCEIYSYEQVHQMVSTVASQVSENKNPVEIIKETFPMGSMTGAPKVSAMQIIEEIESFKRGLYSGAVGYFTPDNDFDFNVVIRSILYNQSNKYVSYAVGSALTSKASPEFEYEECLLKAKAMREVLESSNS
ncbi:anthranilate synthase component I family protein [Maribacter sp. HTCC2170]|uniref:anthranilate synthase component I family protein n=1 Tax=Maribacter sp. (strain HTCC2170 / KCCM 42371) TaxID=313603 RepID=UPI00006B21C5|nr:anthranilate synthase component I family protein [Maribacter sp. HTCC2170]EAR00235.1 para-aminobenzoate synthase component I [Maribacter sp. HTCC2170]